MRTLGFSQLRPEQRDAIVAFVRRQDVFVSLPTGYGKTLCFVALPWTFDRLKAVERQSIVLVVSPLIALMQDQVRFLTERGLSAACVSSDAKPMQAVKEGRFQVVFLSPELLLSKRKCKSMLTTEVYRSNLVAVAIDEAHCVKKWYELAFCIVH